MRKRGVEWKPRGRYPNTNHNLLQQKVYDPTESGGKGDHGDCKFHPGERREKLKGWRQLEENSFMILVVWKRANFVSLVETKHSSTSGTKIRKWWRLVVVG